MERPFADADRRVRPDGVERHGLVEAGERRVGLDGDRPHVVEPRTLRVGGAQRCGTRIGVHRPHFCGWRSYTERQRHWAPATSDVGEAGRAGVGNGAPVDQQRRSLVEVAVGEHSGLTDEVEGSTVHDHPHGARPSRLVVCGAGEVVAEGGCGPGGVRHVVNATLEAMVPYDIRVIGDPVLSTRAKEVTDIDGTVAALVEDMFEVMYDAPGVGLAAPQVGVSRRIFVFDSDDRAGVLINPEIVESDGEWEFVEGCLSIPGLHWSVVRPRTVLLRGVDLDGNPVELEATDFEARIFQHELDHLDGVLLVERLTDEQRREAKRALRELALSASGPTPSAGLQLP